MILKIFLSLVILVLIFISFVFISIWIHENMRGTKIWEFVNKHIITDEDYYIK
jgi:hypothetical protein